jgi:8-oxo-dGTP pyrophosphatase MutT (NUDIX family)
MMQSADVIIYCPKTKRILLARDKIRKYWSIPGGGVDQGEHPHQGGAREVEEEVLLTLDPGKLILLSTSSEIKDERFSGVAPLTFLGSTFAAIVDEEGGTPDDEEIVEVSWASLDEIRDQDTYRGAPIFGGFKNFLALMDRATKEGLPTGQYITGKSPADATIIFTTLDKIGIK